MIPPFKINKIEDFLGSFDPERQVLIDARSPSEFKEDHIPGAINLPVLTDQERAEIGTLYKENSFEARHQGAIRVSRNIASLLPGIEEISRNRSVTADADRGYHKPSLEFVVYCWRGGMRSGSLFTVMDLIGYRASVIDGGYRSYRRMIHSNLYEELPAFEVISVHGPSGTGKSELMRRLQTAGLPALFLEEYAEHRGSLLGGDFDSQPSQKEFESRLWADLQKWIPGGWCIVEGESRQIGRLSIPDLFFSRMQSGRKVWVELPIAERAHRIAKDYVESDALLLSRLDRLRKYLSRSVFSDVVESIEKGDRSTAALLLLREHYDGYYHRSCPEKSPDFIGALRCDTFEELADKLTDLLTHYKPTPRTTDTDALPVQNLTG